MPTIVCYQPERLDGDQDAWRRITDPEHISRRQGTLVVELPSRGGYRALVNGLDVLGGIQVLERGDLVRIVGPDGAEVSFVVGRVSPSLEPGGGRACRFTGMPIHGRAIACWSCGSLFAEEVSEQLDNCPACGEPLGEHDELPPEEELL